MLCECFELIITPVSHVTLYFFQYPSNRLTTDEKVVAESHVLPRNLRGETE